MEFWHVFFVKIKLIDTEPVMAGRHFFLTAAPEDSNSPKNNHPNLDVMF
jgi:hypothetical protein